MPPRKQASNTIDTVTIRLASYPDIQEKIEEYRTSREAEISVSQAVIDFLRIAISSTPSIAMAAAGRDAAFKTTARWLRFEIDSRLQELRNELHDTPLESQAGGETGALVNGD